MHIIVPRYTSDHFVSGGYINLSVNSDRVMQVIATTISNGAEKQVDGAEIIMDDGEKILIIESLRSFVGRLHERKWMHDIPPPA